MTRYQPELGALSSYAVVCIRGAILRDIGRFMGSGYRSVRARPVRAWVPAKIRRPRSLNHTVNTGDGWDELGNTLTADVDVAGDAVSQATVDEIFAACVDDLDRAIVQAILDDELYGRVSVEFGVTTRTVTNRLARLRKHLPAIRRQLEEAARPPTPNFTRKER